MDPDALSRRVFDSLVTGVMTLDSARHISSMNPACETLFGVSANQCVGRDYAELVRDDEELLKPVHQALNSGQSITVYQARLPAVHQDREATVDYTVSPMAGATGQPHQLLIELIPIERLLQRVREESHLGRHAANQAVLRGLAHEIKNPLGGLRGAAQLLDGELGSRELREYTRIIIHEADRLSTLVDRMMGSYKPIERVRLNVHEVLEHVRKLILVDFQEGPRIDRDYDPSLPEIVGDRDQLVQAALNILRNAAQAVEHKGSICLRTRIERNPTFGHICHRQGIRIDIEDDGPGVPRELADQIFYPLVTGRADGTGLGLSIAQDIIAKHGGYIEFMSQPGRTRFAMVLPITQAKDDNA